MTAEGLLVKAAPFEYHAPETLDEALALLAEFGDEAKVLAGGQSLVPILALRLSRFEHLIDLNRIPALRYVAATDGATRRGSATSRSAIGARSAARSATPTRPRSTRPWPSPSTPRSTWPACAAPGRSARRTSSPAR